MASADAFGNAIGNSIVSAATRQNNALQGVDEFNRSIEASAGRAAQAGTNALVSGLEGGFDALTDGAINLAAQTPTSFLDVIPFSMSYDGIATALSGGVGAGLADAAGIAQTQYYIDARNQAFRGVNSSFERGYARGTIAYQNSLSNRDGVGLDARTEYLRQFQHEQAVWAQGRHNAQEFSEFVNNPYVVMTLGSLQTLEGAVLTGTGALLSSTGLGALAGAPLAAFGADQMQAGLRTIYNREYVDSYTNQGLQAAGLSPAQASVAEALVGGAASYGSIVGDLGRTSRYNSTYTGNVYDSNFVGPVDWVTFYRGEGAPRSNFVSSLAEESGVSTSRLAYLEAENTQALSRLFDRHGNLGSQGLPTIGVTKDPVVAEFFARGPNGNNPSPIVTEFKMQSHVFDQMAAPNIENRRAFRDPFDPFIGINHDIGRPELEYLFNTEIPSEAFVRQWPVR